MFSFLRAGDVPRAQTASQNPVRYDGGRSSVLFHPPIGSSTDTSKRSIMTHTIPPTHPTLGGSIVTPPFHYHIHQSERFNVQSGIGHFYRGLDKAPFAILSSTPGQPRTAHVPAGRYHRFENASETEDLVVDIQLDPEDYENEQRFFRNFFGYLDDCKTAGKAPSIFQLMVFLHAADTPLALPAPTEGIGRVLSRIFLIVMAGVGRWVLGYRVSYNEKYTGPKER